MTSKWEIASLLIWLPHVVWTWAFVARLALRGFGRKEPRIARWLFFEIRPFVPALIAGRYICYAVRHGTDGIGWRMVFLAFDIAVYAMARREKDDDDDRWKRRAAALANKVSDLGHRLVVVPGGAK